MNVTTNKSCIREACPLVCVAQARASIRRLPVDCAVMSPLPANGMSLARMSYDNMPGHVASNANGFTSCVLATNLPLDLAFCLSAKGLRLPVTLGLFW